MRKRINVYIGEILTEEEIQKAAKLGKAREIEREIIRPNIERINKVLGQENDTLYLAYAVEYAISQAKITVKKYG